MRVRLLAFLLACSKQPFQGFAFTNSIRHRKTSRRPRLNAQTTSSASLLEDETGHINGMLAGVIFDWEQQSREKQNLPQVEYSIRSGLRLVEQLVQEVLQKQGNVDTSSSLYSDLVQEGLIALLDAMQHYRESDNNNHEQGGFGRYAQQEIKRQLDKSVSKNLSNRPMRLPKSVVDIVQKARLVAQEMAENDLSGNTRRPTLDHVAERIHVPTAQLRDYLNLVKLLRPPTLSMESTMEISHPLLDESVLFQDWEEWERTMESMTTSSTSSSSASASSGRKGDSSAVGSSGQHEQSTMSEYYLDNPDLQDLEGDDQAWIVQQEAEFGSGTLSDIIPDANEPSPDDLVLQEMIRHDVSEFLQGTLSEMELKVIRSVFGLDSGKQSTLKRTAADLDLSTEQVSVMLAGGLQKLRESYTKQYIEPWLESSDHSPGRIMDSV